MNYHVGRDGQQLGTFTGEQIAEGLANGTLLSTDLGWTEGMAEWQPLSGLFPAADGTPLPLIRPMPVAPQPVFAGQGQTSGMAITSLVLGILGFVFFLLTAIPAVVCGHIALGRIKNSNGTETGRGMAVTGLVLGYFVIALIPLIFGVAILAGLAVPAFSNVQEKARQMQAVNNARQVMISLRMYAGDHNGKYPATLDELSKDNLLPDSKMLEYPQFKGWTPETGYEYFGAGATDSDDGNKIILRSRSQGPHGKRIEAHNDGSVSIQTHETVQPSGP